MTAAASDSNTVGIIIQATDAASQVFDATGAALQTVALNADFAKAKVLELGGVVIGLGGGAAQRILALGSVIGGLRKTLDSPLVKPFLAVLREEAEAATQEIAPLSQLLGDLASVSGSFGKGFFGLDGSVVDTFEARATKVADKIGNLLTAPFKNLGQSENKFLSSIGRAVEAINIDELGGRFDKSIANSLTGGVLDAALGTGPAQSFVKGIITSDPLKSFFPSILQDLVGGSVLKPLTESLGLGNLGSGVKLPVAFDFSAAGVDKLAADFLVDRAVENRIGTGVVSDFVKTIVRPAATLVGPEFAKRLAQGSFSGAVRSLFIDTLTGGFRDGFNQVNQIATTLSGNLGTKLATRLIDGPSEAVKRLLADSFPAVNKAFDGISGKGIKGLDVLSLVPGLDQLDSLLGDRISTALGKSLDRTGAAKVSEFIRDKATQLGSGVVAQGLASILPPQVRATVVNALTDTTLTRFVTTEGAKLFQGLVSSDAGQMIAQNLAKALAPITESDLFQRSVQGLRQFAATAKESLGDSIRGAASGIAGFGQSLIRGARPAFTAIDDFFENVFTDGFREIGANSARSFGGSFAKRILAEITPTINQIDSAITGTFNKVSAAPGKLLGGLDALKAVPEALAGYDEPLEVFGLLKEGAASASAGIFAISENLYFFQAGMQALQQLVLGGPFELLIGQNVKLREQLLATQSTLAGTNNVFQGGQRVADPTQAIQALKGPIDAAIGRIRKGSLELVNVTSKDLVDSFQIIAGQAGNIGFSLEQASQLTLSFGAALGTLGVPLVQARQEISSILTGQIDQNSVVAKSLGLTNQQIELYRSQGTLVDRLLTKLSAFRAGNALAAQTLGGVTSNIQELVDEIGRLAGEPLLEPIVAQVNELYGFLNANKGGLAAFVSGLAGQFLTAGMAIVDIVKDVSNSAQGIIAFIPEYLVESLVNAIIAIRNAVRTTLTVLQPAISLIGELVKQVGPLAGTFLQAFIQIKALQIGIFGLSGAFGILGKLLPGVGELLFFLDLRTGGVANQFSTLSRLLGGPGAAGFLLLGKNLNAVPGLAGAAASALGPFGGILVGLIPGFAGVAVQAAGLLKLIPGSGAVLQNFLALSPGLVGNFARLAGTTGLLGGALAPLSPLLFQAADQLGKYADATSLAEVVNTKFQSALVQTGRNVAQQVLGFGFLAIGAFLAFQVFDRLVLKNESVKAGLIAVGNALKSFNAAIVSFLSNPVVLATLAVTGLIIAVKTGLLPTLIDLGKALVVDNLAGFNNGLAGIKNSIANFVMGTASNLGDKIGLGNPAKLRKDAADLASTLQDSSAEFEGTLAKRNARLAQIDQAIPLADPSKARVTGRKPVGDLSALQSEKANILKEIGEITTARQTQQTTLASLQSQAATAPSLAARSGAVLSTTLDRAKGNVTQFAGVAQRLGGDTFIRLGQSVAGVGLDSFGQKLTNTGNQMFALGGKTLTSDSAMKAFGGSVNLSSANIQGIGTRASAAGSAIAAGFKGATSAAVGLAATLGPILLLTAAIAIAVEAVDAIRAVNEAATAATKRYTESVKEAIAKFDELDQKRRAAAGAPPQEKGKTTERLQADRLKEIKEKQNLFAKASDALDERLGFSKDIGGQKAALFSRGQLENESKDFATVLKKANTDFNQFAGERKQKQTALEQDLAELQKKRTEAAAKGNTTEATRLDGVIKLTQDQITAGKASLTSSIDSLTKEKALTAEQATEKDKLLQKFSALQTVYDTLANTEIKGVDLPRLGSDIEQAQQKLGTGLSDLAKGTGLPEEIENKIKASLQSLQELQKASAISPADAEAAYAKIASSSKVSAEAQSQALQGVKQTFQDSLKIQVDTNEAAQSDIQKKVAEGGLTQQEAEEATTTLKKQQLDIQLQNLRDSVAEEQRIRGVQLADTLASIDKDIQAAQDAAAKHPEDAEAQKLADTAATDGLAKKKAAQASYDNFVKRSGQDVSNATAKNSADNAKLTADQTLKTLEFQTKKAQDIAKKAETEREIEVAKLENSGQITHAEAEQAKASTTAASTNRQIEIEKIRLKELQKNEKGNEVAIRESKQKLLDLTKQSLANEQQAYEAYIGVLKEKLTNLAQEYANALEVGSQDLQRQITLYDSLAKALEQRNTLLKAATDLTNASAGYLTGELDALAKTEKSEFRKRELAQITASIKLEALRQEQAIGEITFKIEQEKNRLALERRDIENQIAIAKTKGELAQGAADLRVAQEQKKAGKITQAEFDQKSLALQSKFIGLQSLEQERGLIQREKAIQPVLEAAAAQNFKRKQQTELTNAEVAAFDTLSPGEQANRRDALQGRASSRISGGRFNSRDALVDGLLPTARQTIDDALTGKASSGTNLLATLDPTSQKLLAQLNPNRVQLPTALSTDVPTDLADVTDQIFKTGDKLRGQENKRRKSLGQSTLANQTIADLPTAIGGVPFRGLDVLQPAQPALTLPPADARQQPIQQVQAAVQQTEAVASKDKGAQGIADALAKKAGNKIDLGGLTVNVYAQGTDKAAAQQTGKTFADELEKVIRQAEALSAR